MAASSPSQAPPLIQPLESSPTVADEYGRIFNAHPRHFFTLSLFFLPISCFPLLLPTFHHTFISATSDPHTIPILILISSSLFIFTSYLFAIASITNSVRRAFHHNTTPLTLTPPILSFLSLISTALYAQLLVLGTLLLSRYLLHLSGLDSVLPDLILTYFFVILQLIWGLAYAVAVVESKPGVRAWKRSFDLLMMTRKKKVDEMKTGLGYYCKLVLGDGVYMGLLVWGISPSLPGKTPWPLAVLIPCMIIPGLVTILLTNTMSFAVLYLMSLRLTIDDDDTENQVHAPLLVSVSI